MSKIERDDTWSSRVICKTLYYLLYLPQDTLLWWLLLNNLPGLCRPNSFNSDGEVIQCFECSILQQHADALKICAAVCTGGIQWQITHVLTKKALLWFCPNSVFTGCIPRNGMCCFMFTLHCCFGILTRQSQFQQVAVVTHTICLGRQTRCKFL